MDKSLIQATFEAVHMQLIACDGDLWIPGTLVGVALEYLDPRNAINKIYERHMDELEPYSLVMTLAGLDESTDPKVTPQAGGLTSEEGAGYPKVTPQAGGLTSEEGPDYPKVTRQTPSFDSSDDAHAPSGSVQKRLMRVYNEEGVMIITMLSRQPKAAAFRAWAVRILKAYRRGELALMAGGERDHLLELCLRESGRGNVAALHTLVTRYGYPQTVPAEQTELLKALKAPASKQLPLPM